MNMRSTFSMIETVIGFWSSWMISMSWQVAALVGILAMTGFLLRHRSARVRYSVWTLVPIRLLLPPSLALVTGWAWWLLPCETTAISETDAGPATVIASPLNGPVRTPQLEDEPRYNLQRSTAELA